MKIRIIVLNILIGLGIGVVPIWGETLKINIKFNSPPATIPDCKTRFKTIDSAQGKVTLYEVIVENSLEPEIAGSNVSARVENNTIVFSFVLKGTGSCEATLNGYHINLSDGATDIAGNNQPQQVTTVVQPQTAATPNVNFVPTASKSEIAEEEEEVKKDALDLSVPESPGFTILGLTPQDVIRPATPRKFAAALLSSIDKSGNLQNGIAIDTVPYLLLAGNSVTLDKYREKSGSGYLTRLLSRTQLSLATTKGASDDDKSARIGLGVNITFFDFGDPNLDEKLDECFVDVATRARNQARQEFGLASGQQPPTLEGKRLLNARIDTIISETYKSQYKTCLEESRKRNFARSSFVVGSAGSWISESGESSKFKSNGQGVWTSLAYGFEGIPVLEEKSQLILHFRRRVKESVTDPLNAGQFINKDSNLVGLRLRFGVPNWTGNIEGGYQGEHFAGRKADSNFKISFGSDYRIASNLYLNFSIGGETKNSTNSENKVFVRTSFNWGASQKPLN